LTFIEATAVSRIGRITPGDSGLWSDSHIQPIRNLTEFAHLQGQKIGIQLAHAGRKASMVAPWVNAAKSVPKEEGGWPDLVVGPTDERFSAEYNQPRALSTTEVEEIVQEWVEAAKRAVKAGVDVIEIHAAHGFLLFSFLSPVTNKRTDRYGGSFENRIRLLLEVVNGVRAVIPETMPLFVRVSASEYLEETLDEPSWTIEETVKLGGILASHGVDLYDLSAGGNHPAQKIAFGPLQLKGHAYQAHFSDAVRKVHGIDGSETKKTGGKPALLVGAVGGLRNGQAASEVLESDQADIVFVGRQFQKDPATVWTFADQLGVRVKTADQIEWAWTGRASSVKESERTSRAA